MGLVIKSVTILLRCHQVEHKSRSFDHIKGISAFADKLTT